MLFRFKRRKKRKRQKATSNRRVFLKPSPKVVQDKDKSQKIVSHETRRDIYDFQVKRDYFERVKKNVRKSENIKRDGFHSSVLLHHDIDNSISCKPCRLRKERRRSLFAFGYAGKGKAIHGKRVHTEDSKRSCGGC